ncbi:hypothetical protein FACS189421_02940 [Bacteroidia bacterium]|nr:hypothetical protein FACS189421_02940 [Bacteroidia bacterium]
MKNYSSFGLWSLAFGLCVGSAHAAGTYYTPNYQSPQYSRQPGYQPGYQQGYYQGAAPQYQTNASTGAAQYAQAAGYFAPTAMGSAAQRPASSAGKSKRGFELGAGIGYESAVWDFSMKEAGSNLHFDNITWLKFDVSAGYTFDVGAESGLKIAAGLQMGTQMSDSKMIDDDISSGGFPQYQWVDSGGYPIPGMVVYGHSLSTGTSSGGSLLGYYAGIGLTDTMKLGNLRVTPSVGYRSLSYNLKTGKNFGMSMDTGYCEQLSTGEINCLPAIIVDPNGIPNDGDEAIFWPSVTGSYEIPGGTLELGQTYYYDQPGTSHNYKVDWSGPYLALDAQYDINQYNYVTARIELGFPGYKSSGDQPYRWDWAKPVEDSAGMFSAMHIGFLANYTTAITDSVGFQIGLTYDYYTVSGAQAKTFMNEALYWDIVNIDFGGDELAALDSTSGSGAAIHLNQVYQQCGGWVCTQEKEVDSFYRSLGIRIGIAAKF